MFSPAGQTTGIQGRSAPVQRAFDVFLKVNHPASRGVGFKLSSILVHGVDVDKRCWVLSRAITPVSYIRRRL